MRHSLLLGLHSIHQLAVQNHTNFVLQATTSGNVTKELSTKVTRWIQRSFFLLILRSIVAGDHRIVFVCRGPLVFVAVAKSRLSENQVRSWWQLCGFLSSLLLLTLLPPFLLPRTLSFLLLTWLIASVLTLYNYRLSSFPLSFLVSSSLPFPTLLSFFLFYLSSLCLLFPPLLPLLSSSLFPL